MHKEHQWGFISMMNDWDDLRIFLAVARQGSVTQAAIALEVNHSTVSRRIGAFEKKIGTRLFDRLSSGFAITQAGEELMTIAQEVERSISALDRKIMAQDHVMKGKLRIAVPATMAASDLMPYIAEFSKMHPDVEMQIFGSDRHINLHMNEADIAIRVTNTPPETLMGRRVANIAGAVYAAQIYLQEYDCTPETIIDRQNHRWVWHTLEKKRPNWLQKYYPNARMVCQMDSKLACFEAINHGLGIGQMPCRVGDADPTLHRIPPFDATPDLDVWVLYHPSLAATARIQAFSRHIANAFAKELHYFEGQKRPIDRAQ